MDDGDLRDSFDVRYQISNNGTLHSQHLSKMSAKPRNIISEADRAVLAEKYEFVPPEDKKPTTWQDRMVERYHAGLYKEFALADLSRPGKLGLRWRTQQEVVQGRGEKSCGNKRCQFSTNLVTLEVPFSYVEGGVAKKELVKLKLCPSCRPLVEKKSTRKEHSTEHERDASSKRKRLDSDADLDTCGGNTKGVSRQKVRGKSEDDDSSVSSSSTNADLYGSRKRKKKSRNERKHYDSDESSGTKQMRKRRKKQKKCRKYAHR